MKKSKSVVLLVLTMVLVLSMAFSGIMTVNAADSKDEFNNTYRVGLLEALKISKISGIGVSEWTGNLTRGEAAFLIAGLVQMDRSKKESIFDDVSIDAYYAGSVASLNEASIVLKSWGSKKFKPDEPIEYGEFLTMLCKALGYGAYAESKGGYPIGYITVAKQFKLTKGIELAANSNLDKKYVPKILMNALDASYLAISEIDSDGNFAAEKKGIVLNDYFDIYTYSGILEEAGPFSMTNDFFAGENNITVGGYNFRVKNSPAEYIDLLGQDVTVYYKEGKSTVYVYPEDKNNVLVINAEDLNAQSVANAINYVDANGKEAKAKLSNGYITLYNGTLLEGADIESVYGKVSLVDNDGDNKYDVVKISEYQLAVVSAIDSYNKTITFDPISNSDPNFDIDIEDTASFKLTGTNGKTIKPTALAAENIVLYAVNDADEENLYYDFIVSKTTVSGAVTEIGSEEIGVDGKIYNRTALYPDMVASMGDDVVLHLDANGKVIYIEVNGYNYKDAKYAIFLGFNQIRTGSKPQWEVDLYTQDGARVYLPIAEKVKFNGGNRRAIKDEATRLLFESIPVEDMIKYKISNGELTEIMTATDWGTEFRYWEFGKEFNRYSVPGSPNWRTTDYMFSSWVPLASDAIRFYIKHDESGKFDEEKSIVSTTKPNNDQPISNIVLWDIDKAGRAHAYMCTPNESENLSTGSGSNNYSFFIVTKVIEGKDSEGNTGKYIFGTMGGSEKQYFLSSDDYEDCGITPSNNPFKIGNVIKIRTNGSNIVGIMKSAKNSGNYIVFDKSELDEPVLTKSNAVHSRSYEFAKSVATYYSLFAKIIKIEDGLVYFACAGTDGSFGIAQISSVDSAFCVKMGGTVYKYDPEGEELFNVVSWNDVKESTGLTGSSDDVINGSTVLINVTNFAIADVIILD